jgi:hypothetical protein
LYRLAFRRRLRNTSESLVPGHVSAIVRRCAGGNARVPLTLPRLLMNAAAHFFLEFATKTASPPQPCALVRLQTWRCREKTRKRQQSLSILGFAIGDGERWKERYPSSCSPLIMSTNFPTREMLALARSEGVLMAGDQQFLCLVLGPHTGLPLQGGQCIRVFPWRYQGSDSVLAFPECVPGTLDGMRNCVSPARSRSAFRVP